MAVNPEKHKHVKYAEAMQFVNWSISPEGQKAIGSFKTRTATRFLFQMQRNRE
jgi:tungstate transport system substrate-binding protein